jgi:hypothetical protein
MSALIKGLSKNKQADSIQLGRFWMVLLFTLMLVFSILYHLPASWLITQPVLQKQIPKPWLIEAVQGSVWDGEMAISMRLNKTPGGVLSLGDLEWDIDSSSLLKGIIGSQQKWSLAENSQIDFHITRDVFSIEKPFFISGVQGSLDIEKLIKTLSLAGLATLAATGQVNASDIEVALDPSTMWPQKASGQFQIRSLSTLGMDFPVLTVVPSMEAQTVLLNLSAQEHGWQLKGRVRIRANHTYDVKLSVKGDSAEKMPDWAQIMVQNNPTLSTFISQGRW